MREFYIWRTNGDDFATLYGASQEDSIFLSPYRDYREIRRQLSLQMAVDDRGMLPVGDFVNLGGSQPKIISQKAFDVMSSYLESSGTVVEVKLQNSDEKYYVFYLKNSIDCLDTQKSDIVASASGYLQLVKPVISSDLVTGSQHIFSARQFPFREVYISEEVYKKIVASKLTGGRFTEVGVS